MIHIFVKVVLLMFLPHALLQCSELGKPTNNQMHTSLSKWNGAEMILMLIRPSESQNCSAAWEMHRATPVPVGGGQSQGSVWYGVQRHHWLLTTSMQKSSSQNWSPNFISFTSGSKSLLKVESHFLPVLPVCKSGFVDISGDHGLKLDYMVKNYHRKQHKNCHLVYKQPTSPAPHSVFKAHFKGLALHTYYKIYIQAIIFNSRLWV